jgi:hypothetical protein
VPGVVVPTPPSTESSNGHGPKPPPWRKPFAEPEKTARPRPGRPGYRRPP